MTIEEKAKAYDLGIKKLQSRYQEYCRINDLVDMSIVRGELEEAFPELKEHIDNNKQKEVYSSSLSQEPHIFNCESSQQKFVTSISENLAEAYEYLSYTHTSNLAHNKPMVAARIKRVIKSLFKVGLFKLTHDEKARMENLGLLESL
jgi:ATP/maltotriose-dependent transcriptional regulator MalT